MSTADTGSDPGRLLLDRVAHEMGLVSARSGLRPRTAEQLPNHWQRLPKRQRLGGKAVSEVMNADVDGRRLAVVATWLWWSSVPDEIPGTGGGGRVWVGGVGLRQARRCPGDHPGRWAWSGTPPMCCPECRPYRVPPFRERFDPSRIDSPNLPHDLELRTRKLPCSFPAGNLRLRSAQHREIH